MSNNVTQMRRARVRRRTRRRSERSRPGRGRQARLEQQSLIHATDDVWKTLHRCLTDGTLAPTAGEFPLNHCFLGGRQLSRASGFSVTLVRPDMTRHVAAAISQLADDDLRARYDQYLGHTADATELDDATTALHKLGEFFNTASALGHAVVFATEIDHVT